MPVKKNPPAAPRWRLWLLPGLVLAMVVAALWWSDRLTHDASGWRGTRLHTALALVTEHVDADDLPPAQLDWQPVELSDDWKRSRPGGAGSVWYRIALPPSLPADAVVLIPRLATSGQVFFNGSRLWDGRAAQPGSTRAWNAPLLFSLPAALQVPQGNELQVQVSGLTRYRAGLSFVQLGTQAELQPVFQARRFWQHDGAMLSCAVSIIAGLLTVFTWLRARDDPALLLFGLAAMFWGLRNSNLFLDGLPITVDQWAIVVHTGHTWFNTLFGLFVLRFTGVRSAWARRALWAYGTLGSAAMFGGALVSFEQVARWTIAPAAAMFAVLVVLLLRKGWRDRSVESALIAATTVTFVVLSLRDGLLLASRLPYEAYYLSHYTGVLMLVVIAWGLVARLEYALRTVEQLNSGLERRVQERTRSLEAANAAKTRFIAAAGHDLRQPVAAIGLLSGLLREQASGAERMLAERIGQAVQSLETLLLELLDLSRLESGTLQAHPTNVALAPLLRALAGELELEAHRKGLALRVRAGAHTHVRADAALLQQVLRNLIGNALRYTDRGGVLLAARRLASGRVRLQVWDTGRGIAPAEQARAFDEFVRLGDGAAEPGPRGLGLGLAIARRAADLMGAAVHVRSVPGRGSCFWLDLPAGDATQAAATEGMGAAPPVAGPALAGLRVLLVDDEPAVLQSMQLRLQAWGATVQAFADAAALRNAIDAAPVRADLLITDNRLPDADAAAVVRMVRQRLGPLPVLVITGDTAPGDWAQLQAQGLPLLHKPFDTATLLAALVDALAQAGSPIER